MPSTKELSSQSRSAVLDALRGVAALIVVVCHCLSANRIYNHLTAPEDHTVQGVTRFVLFDSPLHILWNGAFAVDIFFVLSGYVLTTAILRSSPTDRWRRYYPKRLVRLYAPVVASLSFAYLLAVLVPRTPTPAASVWLNGFTTKLGLLDAFRESALLLGPGNLNPPLWSLRQEVILSMLLPAYVFATRVRIPDTLKLVGYIGVVFAAALIAPTSPTAHFVTLSATLAGAFGSGTVLATAPALRTKCVPKSTFGWWVYAVVTLAAANAYFFFFDLHLTSSLLLAGAYSAFVAAAALCVLAALECRALQKALQKKVPLWLGQRSFALYLIHLPIVIAVAYTVGPNHTPLLVTLSLPVVLLATELFYRLVDVPSQRLSARVAQKVTARSTRG